MTDSEQRLTTKSGSRAVNRPRLEKPPDDTEFLPGLVEVGTRFGLWRTSSEVWRVSERPVDGRWKAHRKVMVTCECGLELQVFLDNLRSGKSTGCGPCKKGRRKKDPGVPTQLRQRLAAAYQRCTSENNAAWEHYGGRGIKFNFASIDVAARWVLDNLGDGVGLYIDRIDNNGHYEPGNLRWATASESVTNRRPWKKGQRK